MKPFIIGGEITSCCARITCLFIDTNTGPESVPVAPSALKSNRNPVLIAAVIHQDEGTPAKHRHDRVHPTVIVQISKGQPPGCDRGCDTRRCTFEAAILVQ